MTLRQFLILLAVIIGYFLIVSLWGFYRAIRPYKTAVAESPKQYGLQYEDVSLHTQDNVLIRGWFIPNVNANAKAIILLHGYPDNKGSILATRHFLSKKYHLLFIDFRYLGESGGSYHTVGKKEVFDLLAAVDFLRNKGIQKIGIWGFSLGGAVALMAAEREPAIRAIVAEASYANLDLMLQEYYTMPLLRYPLALITRMWALLFLRLDPKTVSPVDSVKNLEIPLLLIHSEKDETVPFAHAKLLQEALKDHHNAQFLWLETGRHGELSKKEYSVIDAFFDKNLN